MLSHKYTYYTDHEREKAASVFTADGVLDFALQGKRLVGRPAIAEHFKPRPGVVTMNICSNVVVEVVGDGQAKGSAYMISFGGRTDAEHPEPPLPMPTPRTVGVYHDVYVRENGVWLFQSRRLESVFKGDRFP